MKGFVPTPPSLVDRMIDKLFAACPPTATSTLLDPGCGSGVFVEGVIRWCQRAGAPIPQITAIDSDIARISEAEVALAGVTQVTLVHQDFLTPRHQQFDYIVGNPPYVSLADLDASERARYRAQYRSASGRFDLYLLFFEQALDLLSPNGRLVFVTPEKFLYVQAASALRRELAAAGIEEIELIDEASFPGMVTYPAVTTIDVTARHATTRFISRDGTSREVVLDGSGASWLPAVNGAARNTARYTLADAFVRISCGVATGADDVFVLADEDVPSDLREFAHPTISGRELTPGEPPRVRRQMLVPYGIDGTLLTEWQLGSLGAYLATPARRARLMKRTCVVRKPWYAFHETPPLEEMRRPKILCKDIGARPWFVVDQQGDIVPRHSVYYLVPKDPDRIDELCAYLNSADVEAFLMANCQRAMNGFVRLQSHVLKTVPLPERFVEKEQLALV